MAAALGVTEPCSTGIGGDYFLLYWDNAKQDVFALLGNGAAPEGLTLKRARDTFNDGVKQSPYDANTVTVPGAAAGWVDTVKEFGSGMPLSQVLEPAISLAEKGFPVAPIAAYGWNNGVSQLKGAGKCDLLVDGHRSPTAGELFRNPHLAATYRKLGAEGAAGFYQGSVAAAIAKEVQALGGVLTEKDLAEHKTDLSAKPIKINYKGIDVYEVGTSISFPSKASDLALPKSGLQNLVLMERLGTDSTADAGSGCVAGSAGCVSGRGPGRNGTQLHSASPSRHGRCPTSLRRYPPLPSPRPALVREILFVG